MITFARALLAALLLLGTLGCADAQFTSQREWAGTSGGSANAQTLTLPNYSRYLTGVPIRFIAGFTNTGSATVNVNGLGALVVKKSVGTGLVNLAGREMSAGAVSTLIYDGSQLQLISPLDSDAYCTSITAFGGNGNGSADNGPALALAFTAMSGTGGCVAFPPGKFAFNAPAVINLPNTLFGLRITGSGPDSTVLYWPNAGDGIIVNLNNPANSVHVDNVSITTGASNSGSGNGLTLNQATCLGSWALSYIQRVTFRGDDNNNTFHWWTGAVVNKVSGTNWDTVIFYGSAANLGSGMLIQGDTDCYSIQHNLAKVYFNSTAVGFTYGKWLQGVTITQGNFTNGTIGLQVPASIPGVLSQLNVFDSQFNTTGDQIQILSQITPLLIHNNLMFVPTGHSAILVNLGPSIGVEASFVGNNFRGLSTVNTNGLVFRATEAIVTGNTFIGLTTGVWMQADASNTNTQSNYYQGNSCGVILNATCVFGNNGVANQVGTAPVTGAISGITTTTMTVTGVAFSGLAVGQMVTGPGITLGTYIVAQLSGIPGGTGTYTVSPSQTAGAASFTAIGGSTP